VSGPPRLYECTDCGKPFVPKWAAHPSEALAISVVKCPCHCINVNLSGEPATIRAFKAHLWANLERLGLTDERPSWLDAARRVVR